MNDTPICKHCGEAVERVPSRIPCLEWVHATGYYGCNKSRPSHSTTYAEPEGEP